MLAHSDGGAFRPDLGFLGGTEAATQSQHSPSAFFLSRFRILPGLLALVPPSPPWDGGVLTCSLRRVISEALPGAWTTAGKLG